MPNHTPADTHFLEQLNAAVAQNLANEAFGVSELAEAMNMSRSNLLRKVKKLVNLPVNQLIREARLTHAMQLLQNSALNVSEVSHQVGFNSTSYFIKCFREHYGYSPGETGKYTATDSMPVAQPIDATPVRSRRNVVIGIAALVILLCGAGVFLYVKNRTTETTTTNPSIVVLPFKNESNDSTNVYLINGLMESTLNNLQKIKDLRVLSRTSSEKYRHTTKSIPEMAGELNAYYFIEGSGQKMGDQILLTIQLIEGPTDKHLWSRQYRREAKDIFALQQEIAKNITEEIQVIISPDVKQRIEKNPTENLQAYDSFLKGVDKLNTGGDENLLAALGYFQQAIEHDKGFALAYACAAITCYYLDVYKAEQPHLEALRNFADKALLYDPKLAESFTAKAMYFLARKQYPEALPYLEKGLAYNPNSTRIIGLLADFYSNNLPNTGKYLEYALRGAQLDAGSGDSVSVSYFYLRLGNALIQTGFVDEALTYIDKSLAYNPRNPFSRYVRAYVVYAKNKDLAETRRLLLTEFNKDTTRLDILQDIGKVSFYLKDFTAAYGYYKRFNAMRDRLGLDVYKHENITIATVYEQMGEQAKAKAFLESYRQYLETDQSAYRDLGFAVYYDHQGDTKKALDYLARFTKQDNIQYWVILFMRNEPVPSNLMHAPGSKKLLDQVEAKFWANHNKLKLTLQEKDLL